MSKLITLLVVSVFLFGSCRDSGERSLPILGEKQMDMATGEEVEYRAPAFQFVNQSNESISEKNFEGKVQVVDFFFTSCPTICPKMTNHLEKVQDHFLQEDKLAIISFSIDPTHDTPERLTMYADLYGVDPERWSLLTGKETDVFELAKDYKVMAFDDSMQGKTNLIHDGTFVLVDNQRRIRGYYNGLEETEVNRLINDVELLLKSI